MKRDRFLQEGFNNIKDYSQSMTETIIKMDTSYKLNTIDDVLSDDVLMDILHYQLELLESSQEHLEKYIENLAETINKISNEEAIVYESN